MTKLDAFRGPNPSIERSPQRHSRIVLYAWWTPPENDVATDQNGPRPAAAARPVAVTRA